MSLRIGFGADQLRNILLLFFDVFLCCFSLLFFLAVRLLTPAFPVLSGSMALSFEWTQIDVAQKPIRLAQSDR